MSNLQYLQLLQLAAPEAIVTLTLLAVLGADLTVLRGKSLVARFNFGALLAVLGCVAAAAVALSRRVTADPFNGFLAVDPASDFIKVAILGLTVFTILISTSGKFTNHVGEYVSLLLLGTIGLMFLISTVDVLMIFIALEFASLSLYILAAFNKHDAKSSEAALKYFLFGGMSAAFLLFGFSLLYGLSGSTNLVEIARSLAGKSSDPLLLVAIVTTVVGFGFKVAAVPFHLWAPDAYEGAPTPSAAFIGSGSKVASFYVLAKIFTLGFSGAAGSAVWQGYAAGWMPVVAVVAALSMVLGNLTAIVQTSVKRLLAYSAIAHAGYMLLGVVANTAGGAASMMFYVITYAATTIGAFGVVMIVEEATGGDAIENFAGLSRRAPVLSLCLLIFLLSLGGIPPLAGFIAKFFLFSAVVLADGGHLGLLWLVILAIAMSAVSFYYYLLVLKQAFVRDAVATTAIRVPPLTLFALVVLALLVILVGCVPGWLTQFL